MSKKKVLWIAKVSYMSIMQQRKLYDMFEDSDDGDFEIIYVSPTELNRISDIFDKIDSVDMVAVDDMLPLRIVLELSQYTITKGKLFIISRKELRKFVDGYIYDFRDWYIANGIYTEFIREYSDLELR